MALVYFISASRYIVHYQFKVVNSASPTQMWKLRCFLSDSPPIGIGVSNESLLIHAADEFEPGLDAFVDIIVGRSLAASGRLFLTNSKKN